MPLVVVTDVPILLGELEHFHLLPAVLLLLGLFSLLVSPFESRGHEVAALDADVGDLFLILLLLGVLDLVELFDSKLDVGIAAELELLFGDGLEGVTGS